MKSPLQVREYFPYPFDTHTPSFKFTMEQLASVQNKAVPGRNTTPFIPPESPFGEMI